MNASTELRLANKVMVSSGMLSRGRAADSGGCLILLVDVAMATDRFRWMLRLHRRNLTGCSPPFVKGPTVPCGRP